MSLVVDLVVASWCALRNLREVADELWELVKPRLPTVERRFRCPGRKRSDDRGAWCGTFVCPVHRCRGRFRRRGLANGSGDDLAVPARLDQGRCPAAAARAAAGQAERGRAG